MADIADIPMGEYKRRMCDDTGPRLVQPVAPATANFELKDHILAQLKDILFYGKDHKYAYKHIDVVNDIDNYFNIPNNDLNIQQGGESLYEVWERYKGLLRNCPHNDLNI